MNDSQTLSEAETCWVLGCDTEMVNDWTERGYLKRTGENRQIILESIWVLMDELSGWMGFSETHDIEIKITPKATPERMTRWGVTHDA